MTVPGNHPLAEVIAKKLFAVECVPPEEARAMVGRAVRAAVEWHDAEEELDTLKAEVERLRAELADAKLTLQGYADHARWKP